MSAIHRCRRGADIRVLLAIVGDAAAAVHVSSVAAVLKAADGPGAPPAETPAAAAFAIDAATDAASGAITGWYLTIAASQTSSLAPGSYVTNAQLTFDNGAVIVTEPLFVSLLESTASAVPGSSPGASWSTLKPALTVGTTRTLALQWVYAGPPSSSLAAVVGPAGRDGEPTRVLTAGIALSGHRAVYVGADGCLYPCQPDATARRCIGVTTGAAAAGAPATVQIGGGMTEPTWSWAGTGPVWLGPDGTLSQALPTTGALCQVGIPIGPTMLRIDPQFLALI